MNNTLLPCPFCGKRAHTGHYRSRHKDDEHYLVMCDYCFARTVGSTPEEAIAAWNRRADDERLKNALKEIAQLACESVERDRALARLEAEVMAVRDSMRWIPVTESLPEIDVAVLVLHTYQRDEYSPITIGRLYQPCDKRRNPYWTFVSIQASDGAIYNDGTDFICPGSEYVTHWMPLPEPPGKGET